MKSNSLDLFDARLFTCVAGVDEVGRGCLAGPVVAAAVILDPELPIAGLRDSKKLTAKRREALALEIKQKARAWAIGSADCREIDELNILQATFLAMKRAVGALSVKPDFVRVDGNKLPQWSWMSEAIVKGDDKIAEISAASIIAKAARDGLMHRYALEYPGYDFEHNVGYGTRAHLEALARLGPTPIHRLSFEPIKSYRAVKHAIPADSK